MRLSMQTTIPLPTGMTVEQLIEVLEMVPDKSAKVRGAVTAADRFGSDQHRLEVSWYKETDPSVEPSECVFIKSWVGRCKKPAVQGKKVCSEHSAKKCYACKKQATHDCEATIGAFVCGTPMCDTHPHHH